MVKTIGVMTSGGDCAGLNTAIWGVTVGALKRGWKVYGIHNATDGLFARPMRYQELTGKSFEFPFARLGGTMLGTTNAGNPHLQMKEDGTVEDLTDQQLVDRFKEGIQKLGLNAIVLIGGDGSMAIVSKYCKMAGIALIGIPKTVDNDAPGTECSIGFATAKQVVVEALDKLDTTAQSHNRFMIAEVMGRGAGHLALQSAIAGQADVVLIPEIPYSYEKVVEKIRAVRASGRRHGLIVVAEGLKTPDGKHHFAANGKTFAGISEYFVDRLQQEPDRFNVRATVLGHVQRSGDPVAEDRILASGFAVRAIQLLAEGKTNRVVVYQNGRIQDMGLEEVLAISNSPVLPTGDMVKIAQDLGMYVGDI